MRLSLKIAIGASVLSIAVNYYSRSGEDAANRLGKDTIRLTMFIIVLALLGLIPPLEEISDILAYTYSVIIILNQGSDLLKSVGSI